MTAHRRLASFIAALLVLNVVAAVVAVIVNLPTQFGKTGTDAGEDVLVSGTAISAPLLPVLLLLAAVILVRRAGARGYVGIVAAYLAALLVLIGGIGELTAEGTDDTPKAVLVAAGVAWSAIAVALAWLATAALRERRRGGARMAEAA